LIPLIYEFDNIDPGHYYIFPRRLDHSIFHLVMLLFFGIKIIL
jgi:hypothetical protein